MLPVYWAQYIKNDGAHNFCKLTPVKNKLLFFAVSLRLRKQIVEFVVHRAKAFTDS